MTYLSDSFHHLGNRCNKGGKHFFFFHDKDFSNVKKKRLALRCTCDMLLLLLLHGLEIREWIEKALNTQRSDTKKPVIKRRQLCRLSAERSWWGKLMQGKGAFSHMAPSPPTDKAHFL